MESGEENRKIPIEGLLSSSISSVVLLVSFMGVAPPEPNFGFGGSEPTSPSFSGAFCAIAGLAGRSFGGK